MGFNHVTINDCIRLMQDMVPGQWYPRPTAEESLLSAVPRDDMEGLRTEDCVKLARQENIKFQNRMNKLKRKPKRKPMRQPSVEQLDTASKVWGWGTPKKPRTGKARDYVPELTPSKLKGVQDLLTDLVNPWSADHIEAQASSLQARSIAKNLMQEGPSRPSSPWRHQAQSPEPASPETIKSWTGTGWMSGKTSPASTPSSWTSFNRSEAEAMGDQEDMIPSPSPNKDDLNEAIASSPGKEMTTSDLLSSMSGIEALSFSLEETPEVSPSPVISLGIGQGATVPPILARLVEPAEVILEEVEEEEVPIVAEDDYSDDFYDSVEVFLAKQRRESEIITVSTSESSINTSTCREYGDSTQMSSPMTPSMASLYDEDSKEESSPHTVPGACCYVDDCVKFGPKPK